MLGNNKLQLLLCVPYAGACPCPTLNPLISSLIAHNELLCSSVWSCTGGSNSVLLSQASSVEEDVWFENLYCSWSPGYCLEEVPFWISDLVRAPTVIWSWLTALLCDKEWVFLPKITKRQQDVPLYYSHDMATTTRHILNNKEDLLNDFFMKGSIFRRISLQSSLHL